MPKKIFWITTVSVLIPSIFLCYFGVQTILEQRDLEALLEEKRFQAITENLSGDIFYAIRTQKDLVKAKLEGVDPEAMSREQITDRLAALEDEHNLFRRIFLFNADGSLYYPTGYHMASDSIPEGFGEILENIIIERKLRDAEQFESFGELTRAVTLYRDLVKNDQDTQVQAIALNALARCYGMLDDDEAAARTYHVVAEQYADVTDLNGIRLGLLARYQGARFSEARDDRRGATEQLLALLEDLDSGRYAEIRGQEIFYATKALKRLEGLIPSLTDTDTLLPRYRSARAAAERRIGEYGDVVRFHSSLKARLLVSQSDEGDRFPAQRFSDRAAGEGEIVFSQLSLDSGRYRAALLFSEETLGAFISLAIDRVMKPHDDVVAAVLSEPGKRIAGGETLEAGEQPLYSSPLSGVFPFYRVDLFRRSSLSSIYAERDRAIRIGMIGAFIVLIGIGSYFTFRSLVREAEMMRMKSDFVSNVTHELKTPLTTLKMIGEMLEMGAVPSEARKQDYYSTIASESERLTQLINNVLDFSRIEAGGRRFHFESMDLSPVLQETVEAYKGIIHRNGYRLHTEIAPDLPPVRCDVGAMAQAISNLLDNAVKYSNGSGAVKVDALRDGEDVAIRVADEGIGIPRSELVRIFEKFYRVNGERDPERKGIGLGLTLVREIVEAHGGSVDVESRLGHGSVFTLRIPTESEEKDGADSRRRG